MQKKIKIRKRSFTDTPQASPEKEPPVAETAPPVEDKEAAVFQGPATEAEETEQLKESLEEWRDRALRLGAEMENYRKRQKRLADQQILAERERLLGGLLSIVDDLQRALSAEAGEVESLRQGVAITHQSLMRLLEQEGVRPIKAQGQPFDPNWHEAVGTVPHDAAGADPDTIVEVLREGYRLGDRALRPARVIIAA
jgi:molecular chaperone GrpE